MTLRATATFGNGQTAGVGSAAIVIPTTGAGGAVVAGDIATLIVCAVSTGAGTMTTPSGWTLVTGPHQIGASSELVNTYRKTLVSGDVGATVTVAFSTAARAVAGLVIESAVTATGAVVPTAIIESSATATPALPTAVSVPSGATVLAYLARRYGSFPAAAVGLPAGFTSLINIATNYGSAAEATLAIGRLVAPSAGSYGGTTGTSSPTTGGVNGVHALPAVVVTVAANAGPDQAGVEPGQVVTLTGTGDIWSQTAGSPTVTLAGSGTIRTFTAPMTLAGTTLTFSNSSSSMTADTMTVTVLPSPERIVGASGSVPATMKLV